MRPLSRGAVAGTPLKLSLKDGTYVPSDQTNFRVRGIPVLSFFTGSHAEYHTPDDDVQLLNAAGEAEVLRATYRTARALLDAPSRPTFTELAKRGGDDRGGGASGYGPYLGTVPDFAGIPTDPVPLPFQVADPEKLRQELSDAGLHDVSVETVTEKLEFQSGKDMWDWVVNSNPIASMMVADLTAKQEAVVQQSLDAKLRKRSGGNGPAVLTNPVHIAIGTK